MNTQTCPDPWALVRQAQAGDREAYGELYRQYRPRLVTKLRNRGYSRGLIEDAVSETFVRALRGLSSVTDQGYDLMPWLTRIVDNIVRDHMKSAPYQREITTDEVHWPRHEEDDWRSRGLRGHLIDTALIRSAIPGADVPIAPVNPVTSTSWVWSYVDRLNAGHRVCLQLRYQHDLPWAEVAQRMHRTEGAVRTLHSHALRRLRELVPADLG